MNAGSDGLQVDADAMRTVADRFDTVEVGSIDGTPYGEDVFGFPLLVSAVDRFADVVDLELSHSRSGVDGLAAGLRLAAGHYDDANLTAIEMISEAAYWGRL